MKGSIGQTGSSIYKASSVWLINWLKEEEKIQSTYKIRPFRPYN